MTMWFDSRWCLMSTDWDGSWVFALKTYRYGFKLAFWEDGLLLLSIFGTFRVLWDMLVFSRILPSFPSWKKSDEDWLILVALLSFKTNYGHTKTRQQWLWMKPSLQYSTVSNVWKISLVWYFVLKCNEIMSNQKFKSWFRNVVRMNRCRLFIYSRL